MIKEFLKLNINGRADVVWAEGEFVGSRDYYGYLQKNRHSPIIKLSSQLRVKGGNDYIDYIDNLLHCRLDNTDEIFESSEYEFILFKSLNTLITWLKTKEKEVGLSRLVAGFSWDWRSREGNKIDIEIEGIQLNWNSINQDWINSANAINEVGCIHTTQGYDLNYVGIIFGNEISYDPNLEKIIIIKENYRDPKGQVGITDIEDLKGYIINIYKTLMLRGIKGTYLYVCDKNLREYLEKHIKVL